METDIVKNDKEQRAGQLSARKRGWVVIVSGLSGCVCWHDLTRSDCHPPRGTHPPYTSSLPPPSIPATHGLEGNKAALLYRDVTKKTRTPLVIYTGK